MSNADEIRILHIDDDPDFVDLAEAFLEREDDRITVRTATSPSAGLELLADREIDCVVSDYDMPGQNGIEFLEAVRERHSELPFILYTGKGSEEIASDAISAGVTDYLQKESGTGQYAVLANRIGNAVEQYRSRQAVEATEQKLSELAERTDDILFMFDGDWSELLFVNSAYEEIWGGSIEDLRADPTVFLEAVHPEDREKARESLARLSDGESSQLEYRIGRPDGEHRWIRGDTQPVFAEDGTVERIVGQVRDITEEKERERHLETIVDNLPGYVYRHGYDPEYPLQFVKGDAETVTGYTATELEDDVVLAEEIIHPDDRENLWSEHIEGIAETGRFDSTYRIITKGGDVRWVRDQGQLIEDPVTGKAVIDGFITDVSEHVLREQELTRQQAFTDESLDALQDLFYAIDEDGGLIRWNDRVSAVSGYTDDEIGTMDVTEFFPQEHRGRISESVDDTIETGTGSVQAEIRTADGERIPFEFRNTRLTDSQRGDAVAVGVGRDISEQVRRERELQREHEWFRAIFEKAFDAMLIANDDGEFIDANESATELFGLPEDELHGRTVGEFASDEFDFDAAWEQFQRSDAERGRFPLVRPDGTERTVEYAATTNIVPGQHLSVLRDVTARSEQERRLRALNEVSQELMTADTRRAVAEIGVEAAAAVVGLDVNSIHLYDDERAGLAPVAETEAVRELIGEPPTFTGGDSIAWSAYERGEALVVDDVHDHPDIHNPDTPVESELHLPLGEYGILMAGSESREAFDRQDLVFGTILARSITAALEQVERTEQVRARERDLARQNERLEEFASVVSHDLRNPLTVAEGRLELAREECDSDQLDEVRRAHERMSALIDDLLTLARDGEAVGEFESVDLGTLVEGCWQSVDGADATLVTESDATIRADGSRLQQLVENLMRNAIEHGGEDVTVTVGALNDGFYVEDDGTGISESDRDAVFEAGYSTTGDGTGFGLSIVERVADAHGWAVRVTDGADGGARFEITGVTFVTKEP